MDAFQDYIDRSFNDIVMKKAQSASSPPSSKRSCLSDYLGITSLAGKDFTDIPESIAKRLSSFDVRLSLVEILHWEINP